MGRRVNTTNVQILEEKPSFSADLLVHRLPSLFHVSASLLFPTCKLETAGIDSLSILSSCFVSYKYRYAMATFQRGVPLTESNEFFFCVWWTVSKFVIIFFIAKDSSPAFGCLHVLFALTFRSIDESKRKCMYIVVIITHFQFRCQ